MKTITYRICATLLTSTTLAVFIMQPACGEANNFANHIDFSIFYREWSVSPSNALEQIAPPLMELAASVKTNGTNPSILHDSLWHLFSTNTPYADDSLMARRNSRDYYKMSKRSELLTNIFITSTTRATPQEAHVVGFAKTLSFIRNAYNPGRPFPLEFLNQDAYDAMVQNLMANGAVKQVVPAVFLSSGPVHVYPELIKPRGSDPKEAWNSYELFTSLYSELAYASRKIFMHFEHAAWNARELPQEDRNRIFIEIISSQILTPKEEVRIKEDLGVELFNNP
jgi:hypothetical protein